MVVVLGVYEITQVNSHYILYVGSLIVLKSTLNQASVLPPANKPCIKQLCIAIFALASPKNPPTLVAHFQQYQHMASSYTQPGSLPSYHDFASRLCERPFPADEGVSGKDSE